MLSLTGCFINIYCYYYFMYLYKLEDYESLKAETINSFFFKSQNQTQLNSTHLVTAKCE